MNAESLRTLFKSPVLYQAVGTALGGGALYYIGYRHGKKVMRDQAIAAFEAHEEAQALVAASRVEIDDDQAAWEELDRLKAQVGEDMFQELIEVTKANVQMDKAQPSSEAFISIFQRGDEDWNWDDEIRFRNGNAGPYTITKEEYFEESDPTWTQATATWYEEDQELIADEGNETIYNWSDRIGDMHFGKGSGDPNVVYIRNPDEEMEWEIMRHTGSASEEVRGIAPGEPSGG